MRSLAICLLCFVVSSVAVPAVDWQPAKGPLLTRWAKSVTPANVHAEYPRPQMVRDRWENLNGLWQYAIRPQAEPRPQEFDGEILVPFGVESALSGVMKKVGPENRLWYRREFESPELAAGERLFVHFGAVDWDATVWVNGGEVGNHRGGYDSFSLDITEALQDAGKQEIVVSVWDPTNAGYQPRGKQVREPGGIFYTSVTGIWGTVWLEPVPASRITSLKITPQVDQGAVEVAVEIQIAEGNAQVFYEIVDREDPYSAAVKVRALEDGNRLNASVKMPVKDAKLWTPDTPHLYDLAVRLEHDNGTIDKLSSYFGMRKIDIQKDHDGFLRLHLNNQPLFQFGPLDQGWWPDGLYTAPSDEALRYDIDVTKKLGFNMCRKHVKVEPERWYYWCDRLGLMVWQDMPNGDAHIRPDQPDMIRSAESEANFRREYRALIDTHYNHPSIVTWVPFNEGWGQFKTNEIIAWTKQYDPTRLVDGPSGWADRGSGDIRDMHRYPGPAMPKPEETRAVVLGEFGGLGLPLENHLWWNKRNWGYRTYKTRDQLQNNYDRLMVQLRPLIGRGLAAAIYTQTTDVEGEVNGLMTYDREIVKLDAQRIAAVHKKFYEPQPIVIVREVIPTSQDAARSWRYTTTKPADNWIAADFDDSAWSEGNAGFGEPTTPGAVVRTPWETPDIWIRQTWDLQGDKLTHPHWRVHHDEDVEVYLNGKLAASYSDYTTDYSELEMTKAAAALLRQGKNTIAVHCHQTQGGQYIDVGLVDITEKPRD